MSKYVLPFLIIVLAACSKQADCSECEEELKWHRMRYTIPLDLPEEKPTSEKPDENQITAIVLENNKYKFEDDDTEYIFEEYMELLGERLNASSFKIKAIKIAGHKFAHYEAVFKVLAFCQANELEPVLAYDK